MSKAGDSREKHGNHDAGQVCIDAFGKPLIIDLGSPPYPKDFFSMDRWEYYPASVLGHNIFQFDGQEMRTDFDHKAEIIGSGFDDKKGGWWTVDTTDLYNNVTKVKRTVVHLFPGLIAVYDEAELCEPGEISMRWHTSDRAEPDEAGNFTVVNGDVELISKIVRLDGDSVSFQCREHNYQEPFHMDRNGELLPQKHEKYVEALIRDKKCRLVTLFAAAKSEHVAAGAAWCRNGDEFQISSGSLNGEVRFVDRVMTVENLNTGQNWTVGVD